MEYNVNRFIATAMLLLSFTPLLAQSINGNGEPIQGTRPPKYVPKPGTPWELRDTYGTGQKPAFAGQTRIGAVFTKTPYKTEVITSSLKHPWGISFMPDGRMFITEKPGTMRIVTQGGLVGDTLRGLPKDIAYGGDAGLLDVAVDPDFEQNKKVYLTYVQKKSNGGTGVNVASAKLSQDEFQLEDFRIIYKVNDSTGGGFAHYGARLLFDKEKKLLVSFSERMFEQTRIKTQSPSSSLGKIIRINTDGTAADNPKFTDSPDALPEIWALGFRNPQGLAWNPQTGELWETEHGTQGGDEINIVRPGKNYGWPIIAYGVEYDWKPIGQGITQQPGLEQPVYYWNPTIAPSGCAFYTGTAIPEWKNNLFVAALAGQHLVRLVIENNKVVGEERLLLEQHQRIRDVEMGPDGNLWVVTDADGGRLLKISKKP